jgi:glutathione synthase/RimK-type ligase-like ATP-grasp enzyme
MRRGANTSSRHARAASGGGSVWFVTDDEHETISLSDMVLANELSTRGVAVRNVSWQDRVAWESAFTADAAVIRSTWNYHHQIDAYTRWLRRCSARAIPLLNAPDLVLGNLDKAYLQELERRGLRVAQTALLAAPDAAEIALAMDERGWTEAVLKPRSGASGFAVRKVHRPTLLEDLAETLPQRPFLLQRHMPEIAAGEWSLVYVDGVFVHAVRKVPQRGEFRTNSRFGPHVSAAAPSLQVIADGLTVLGALSPAPLYARVDGVLQDGRLVILEVELNEPGLFLDLDASGHTARALADAILARALEHRSGASGGGQGKEASHAA